MEAGQRNELEFIAQCRQFFAEGEHFLLAHKLGPVERGRTVVGQQFAGVAGVDGLRKLTRQAEVGVAGFHPDEVGVGGVAQAAVDALFDAVFYAVKPSAVRSPVMNVWSRSSMSDVMRLAASASVRAMTKVGTPATSVARRAATSLLMASCVGTSTLPPRWPHFLADEKPVFPMHAGGAASIIAFISSKALRLPPKPASASATMGTNQSRVTLPSAGLDLVAAQQRIVYLFTTEGTESAGYRDWSGYISPALLASAATCTASRGKWLSCPPLLPVWPGCR